MVSECLKQLPQKLAPWAPCPKAADRAAWGEIPADVQARIRETGEAARHEPLAPLPLSLWLDFTRTGSRANWENAYFGRRRMLVRLVMAECVEYTGAYLDKIADTVWAICEESAWQLPAHNSYIRDTPQLPLPDTSRPIVDLFAAETGELLALTGYLLGGELDARAPGLAARIRGTLDARILQPYLHSHFWWMGSGDEPMCNWTSWCTQNVLITAFLTSEDAEVQRRIVKQAAYSLDCFLKDYGADGCCNEGAQYYRHAGLTLWGALNILGTVAPEAFAPLFQQEKIRNIAEYIARVHVEDAYYFNFGDCSPLAGRCGVREFLFGRAVGSEVLMAQAAADVRVDKDPDHLKVPDASACINLWYSILGAFHTAEARACTLVPQTVPDVWYPSVGVYAARRGGFVLGAKMGGNGDSHNHNDTGSFTLYKNGKPFILDIGVESYTKKTFSPQRYEIWTMQSAWHNLPTFGGVMQKDGAAYHAAQVQVEADGISGELAGAYPPVEGLSTYRRRLKLTETGLTLTDTTDWPGKTVLTLMIAQQPVQNGNNITVGTLGAISVPDDCTVEIEAVPVADPRLREAWPDTIWRIQVAFCGTLNIHFC